MNMIFHAIPVNFDSSTENEKAHPILSF